jgi:hypothetical protein
MLAREYDLSRDTAVKLSQTVKRFQPHSLTDAKGDAKLGGYQRTGLAKIDRYVSYRVGDKYVTWSVAAKG